MSHQLSNIFINDFFFLSVKFEICYFAYDKSVYSYAMNVDNIFTNLLQDTWNVYKWFVHSSIKAHPENFQFFIVGNTGLHALQIGNITTKSVLSVTVLGITIDSK